MSTQLQIARPAAQMEITLHRPDCRNALSLALIAELTESLRQIGGDSGVRSVILTGAPPAFCAGLDLREVAAAGDRGSGQAEYDNSPLLALLETIERLPQPVIAAINGPALAGGAALVCACDLAVCAASANLGYPGVKRGLVAPLVLDSLVRLVGERHARFLLLTGQSVPASRAAEMGLVNEVVPDADLLPRAREYAAHFASLPPLALAETKALFARLRTPAGNAAQARRRGAAVPLPAEARAGLGEFLRKHSP
jgi:methylglutaconyl-CoA hydratase